MIKRKLNVIIMSFAMALSFSACDSDSDYESKSTQNFSDCFHHVYNTETGEAAIFDSPRYTIEFDYASGKANVEVKNVKFAEGMPAINMTLADLTWTWSSTTGFKSISATDVVPVVNGKVMPDYIISSFKFDILDRYMGVNYLPVVRITFAINEKYVVTAVQKQICYYGKTNVLTAGSPTAFNTESPYYLAEISEDLTADLKIYDAQFATSMPPMNMVFGDIPVIVNPSVGYVLTADSLIPEIGDTPYPDYEITALSGNANFMTGLSLTFRCMSVFTVTATLGFAPSEETMN